MGKNIIDVAPAQQSKEQANEIVKELLNCNFWSGEATGGVVRIANSCIIQNGRLVEVNLPKDFLPRFQTLEYIRAFLLGRMAWSRLNGFVEALVSTKKLNERKKVNKPPVQNKMTHPRYFSRSMD